MTLDYNQLTAITRKYFVPKMVDNIFNSNVLLLRLWKKGTKLDGGLSIVQPLIYAEGTGGSYSHTDGLTITESDDITAAAYAWKQYYANITLVRDDILKNSGKSAVLNLLKSKVQIAEKTLKNKLGDGLHSDGTGNSSKDITGLIIGVDSAGTYGGINRATDGDDWWQSQELGGVSGTPVALTLKLMQQLFGASSIDNDHPTLGIQTQLLYDKFWSLLQPQQRFTEKSLAKAGFQSLMFNGMPCAVDSKCEIIAATEHTMYMLNEDYLDFVTHKDENFRMEPFAKPVDRNMQIAKIYWMGNLTSSNCRMQGKLQYINPAL